MIKAFEAPYYNLIYTKDMEKYTQHYSKSIYFECWELIVNILKKIEDPRILEIGCGSGQLAAYLYNSGFRKYSGFDFSFAAIELAKINTKANCFVGSAYDKNLYSGDYNVVISTEVLEHVDDDIQVANNIKKDTNIIFTLPSFNCTGHVRYFKSEEEIRERYGDLINITNIYKISVWYVVVGVKK